MKELEHIAKFVIWVSQLYDIWKHFIPSALLSPSVKFLFRSQFLKSPCSLFFTENRFSCKIKNITLEIYIWGCIIIIDTFPKSVHHKQLLRGVHVVIPLKVGCACMLEHTLFHYINLCLIPSAVFSALFRPALRAF